LECLFEARVQESKPAAVEEFGPLSQIKQGSAGTALENTLSLLYEVNMHLTLNTGLWNIEMPT